MRSDRWAVARQSRRITDHGHPGWLDQLRRHGYRFYKITNQGLTASDVVTLTRHGDFTFFNYLFTVRHAEELQAISKAIQKRAHSINLYRTSKFVRHPFC